MMTYLKINCLQQESDTGELCNSGVGLAKHKQKQLYQMLKLPLGMVDGMVYQTN